MKTLDQVADIIDPRLTACFLAGGGKTYCNNFVHIFMAILGVPFAPPDTSANGQHEWLRANWRQVGVASACDAANLNRPAIASRFNPDGHGHLAVLLPGSTPSSPVVCSAGLKNFRRAPLLASFGAGDIDFFLPQENQDG